MVCPSGLDSPLKLLAPYAYACNASQHGFVNTRQLYYKFPGSSDIDSSATSLALRYVTR